MTDKLIGCVQHDCDKCKERESSCNEAYRLAQLRFERIAELEAEVERLKAVLKPLVQRAAPYGEQDWIDGKAALASGAAPKDEAMDKLVKLSEELGLYDGAAHTSKTIDVQWHHDLAKKETDRG